MTISLNLLIFLKNIVLHVCLMTKFYGLMIYDPKDISKKYPLSVLILIIKSQISNFMVSWEISKIVYLANGT